MTPKNNSPYSPALPTLPYGRQCIEEDDIQAVAECLRGDWITQGPTIEKFERRLCELTGAPHAVAVSSGTAALHLAALVLGVKPGDYGVVPPITFTASANAMLYAGGRVRFADVDPATALVDLKALEKCVDDLSAAGTPPKVLVAVDMCGQPADLPAVKRIADKVGAKVIEDAAHSLGASYLHDGAKFHAGCCAHSDAAILSFHPVKQITTGEGGALLTRDAETARRARDLRTHGIHRDPARLELKSEGPWYYEQSELGFHYRITDMQCALGLSQASKLRRFVNRRRELSAQYDQSLARKPFAGKIAPLTTRPGVEHAYHLYVIRILDQSGELKKIAAQRLALYAFLRAKNIFTQVHYCPVNWQPHYRHTQGTSFDDCPNANAYYAGCLSLPLFPSMTDADVARVTDAIGEWLNAR